jgi:hypothetical protein
MLNGRYDSFLPVETSSRPMFDLLGARAQDKQLKLYETDHVPPVNELIKETLARPLLGPGETALMNALFRTASRCAFESALRGLRTNIARNS